LKEKDKAMTHKTRVLIHKYISAHPGISISHLSSIFDLNYSTLKYHLAYLEKNNKIVSKKTGRNRSFYPEAINNRDYLQDLQASISSLNSNQQRILRIIQNNRGISKKKLMDLTKLNRKTMEYSLNKLIDLKLIWNITNSTKPGYEYITEEKLRYEILNRLLSKLLTNEINEEEFHVLKRKLEAMDINELRSEVV
jgi:predicted transcriptional regulator